MKIGNKKIAIDKPTLFIADIAANHDGNINKAIDLIHSCAAAGADVAKFQHFSAETIVSDKGFKDLKKKNPINQNGARVYSKHIKMPLFHLDGQRY